MDSGANPALAKAEPVARLGPSGFDPGELLSEDQMLGSFFKEYADLGHWFDSAHGKCVKCGTATIDLYEDGVYGPVRQCLSGIEIDLHLARLGDYPGATGTRRIAAALDDAREALTDIRNRILCPVGPSPSLDEIGEIAGDALARIEAGTDETRNAAQPEGREPDKLQRTNP